MKKLLVIGVLMSVMLVGCGTQKETTAVEDSTVSNVVAEALTDVLTETAETIEETTTSIEEESTTEVVEEETTTVVEEETATEAVEETTEEETVVEEPAPVEEAPAEEPAPAVEEPAPAVEEPAPVAEVPAEEPAPEVAPATKGTTVTVTVLTAGDDATVHADIKNIVADLGFSVTNYTVLDEWYTAYTVNVSTADDYNKVWQAIYDACYELK